MHVPAFSSNKFSYQNLEPKIEILDSYLRWMQDVKNNSFIESVNKDYSLEKLLHFIQDKNNSPEALLLGIFDKTNGIHFGNIKFEPIDLSSGTAWLGILIGDLRYRGKGYATEVINSTCIHISNIFGINKIYLGVNKSNSNALKTYLKCNFMIYKESGSEGLVMIREV